jgi:hypothetical protein
MLRFRIPHRRTVSLLSDVQGSALLEFAIVLPLLMVFVVGIFDFSGAFNQKQKIEQAAQEGAIIAGAQPMSDIDPSNPGANGPDSLQPVVRAVFNSLAGSGVLPNANTGDCVPPGKHAHPGNLKWKYTISSCPDDLIITIDRGLVPAPGPPAAVCTIVSITYPYHWRFNRVIQLLFPGPSGYAATTQVTESATVHNQM